MFEGSFDAIKATGLFLEKKFYFKTRKIKMPQKKVKENILVFLNCLKKFEVPPKSFYFSSEGITLKQMFEELLNYLQRMLNVFAFDIYADDYVFFTKKLILWTLLSLVIIAIIGYNFYVLREDTLKLISVLFCIYLLPQIAARFYTYLALRHEHLSLKKLTIIFIENCDQERHIKVYEKLIMRTVHFLFCYFIINIMSLVAMVCLPLFYFCFYNERILIVYLELPLLDYQNSLIAFLIHISVHAFLGFAYMISTMATVTSVVIFLTIVFAQFDILIIWLKDLNQHILAKEDEEAYDVLKIIVDIHNDVKR